MAVIIQEDYASFELTRVLKQKGYPLVKVVKDNGDKPLFYDLPKDHPNWNDCDAWYKPTLYQVQKWLDTQHGILVSVGYAPQSKYRYVIMYTDERCTTEPTESRRNFDSGFKALQTGLMEALKRIKKEEAK